MKKYLLLLILFLGITIGSLAQSGWSTGQIYQQRGQVQNEWKWATVGYYQNGTPIVRRYCRTTEWHQRYYEGYVMVWNNGRWTSVWRKGYYWYCRWTGWYLC